MKNFNKELTDHIIITFKDNSDYPIVAPNQVSQAWHDFGAFHYTDGGSEFEIALPIHKFLEHKDTNWFCSHCSNVVRIRTTPRTVLGYLVHPINHFDNTLDENKLNQILIAKYS